MSLKSVRIESSLDWKICSPLALRPTMHDYMLQRRATAPNAYSLILKQLKASCLVWGFTFDPSIQKVQEDYRFLDLDWEQATRARRGDIQYNVQVRRDRHQVANIYRWLLDMKVDLVKEQLSVPWFHPAHTLETVGHCPYCEQKLTHQNWQTHTSMACLAQTYDELAEWGIPQADISLDLIDIALLMYSGTFETLNLAMNGPNLLYYRSFFKTASGTYACWNRREDIGPGPIVSVPRDAVYVYGSEPNSLTRVPGRRRGFIMLKSAVPIGTTIQTTLKRQDDGFFWGVI